MTAVIKVADVPTNISIGPNGLPTELSYQNRKAASIMLRFYDCRGFSLLDLIRSHVCHDARLTANR
nr:MAG TPA: hypothetical protein [Caudoviricetes sp.]